MQYNFTPFKQKLKEAEEWLTKEFAGIRTGRATPTILDTVQVESYGSRMSISGLATINTEDARTIRIAPWDMSQAKTIETAISQSNLGLSVSVDDKGLRVIFPELTGERRAQFVKIAKDKLEDGKIRVRQEREMVLKDITQKEKDGDMSEDERNRAKTEVDKLVQDTNKVLETHFEKKEKEITN